jgi:hypothetical protein
MMKLLLGIFIEVCIAVSLAGIILALVVPVLNMSGAIDYRELTATVVIVGVLVAAVAVALFRPGSAIHRYFKR